MEPIALAPQATDAHRRRLRLRALIVLLGRSRLRIGEALALAETDLDRSRGAVLVRRGKGGKRREVGMDRWAGQQLDPWLQLRATLAARSVLPVGSYRPGRAARRVTAPLLVVVAEDDQSALAGPAVRAAERAPNATVLRVPGGHYSPFLHQHEVVVETGLQFLQQHLTRP